MRNKGLDATHTQVGDGGEVRCADKQILRSILRTCQCEHRMSVLTCRDIVAYNSFVSIKRKIGYGYEVEDADNKPVRQRVDAHSENGGTENNQ